MIECGCVKAVGHIHNICHPNSKPLPVGFHSGIAILVPSLLQEGIQGEKMSYRTNLLRCALLTRIFTQRRKHAVGLKHKLF